MKGKAINFDSMHGRLDDDKMVTPIKEEPLAQELPKEYVHYSTKYLVWRLMFQCVMQVT